MRALQPVILGTDFNAYGMARSFHERFGVMSRLIGRKLLAESAHSKILTARIEPDLLGERFAEILIEEAQRLEAHSPGAVRILLACSDGYVERIVAHYDVLAKHYILPFVREERYRDLCDKEAFYALCKRRGIAIPTTYSVYPHDYLENAPHAARRLGFPLILKPSDGIRYLEAQFPGKHKVYVIPNEAELMRALESVYASRYAGAMLLQEYLPGADTEIHILTTLSDAQGRVRLMSLGRQLLEDPLPTMAGIACAILNEANVEVYAMCREFLEAIGYVGFACIDLKYDAAANRYVMLELNVRQGRNSYAVTAGGHNLADYLVAAFAPEYDRERISPGADDAEMRGKASRALSDEGAPVCTCADAPHLWLGVNPRTLWKHLASEELIDRAKELMRLGRVSRTLNYRGDRSVRRALWAYRYYRALEKRFDESRK